MYIYESARGGLFTSKKKLATKEKTDENEKVDTLLGKANSGVECWNLLKSTVNINHSGGWDKDYVRDFIKETFDEDVIDLIKKEEQIRPKAIDIVD